MLVDTHGLAQVGTAVGHSSSSFVRALRTRAANLTGDEALQQWHTGAVLPQAKEAWSAALENLAGQLRTYGATLGTAAQAYQAADRAIADSYAAVGGVLDMLAGNSAIGPAQASP